MKKIAVFASGAGSNAAKIIEYFASKTSPSQPELPSQLFAPIGASVAPKEREEPAPKVEVSLIVCNKPGAGVLKIADENHIATLLIDKEKFFRGNSYVDEFREWGIDFIVLAGFLWKIPSALIRAFPKKIINIHPALLPYYGGKGMYGQFVHEAVIANKEKESGISIHYVDEQYDHGDIIFQTRCPVLVNDTAETLAGRIHQLEHKHYPEIIEMIAGKA